MSTSRTRDSAAVKFSEDVFSLFIVCSKRFWLAPKYERSAETNPIALSIVVIASVADAALVLIAIPAVADAFPPAPDADVPVATPRETASILLIFNDIV